MASEPGERGRHISRGPISHKCSFGHPSGLEPACKTNRLEVCKSMVRPGCQSCVGCYFKNIGALCVRVSCWWTVLRVVCSWAHHVCPRFVLVIGRWCVFFVGSGETMKSRDSCSWRVVISRLFTSCGGLAVGFAGKDSPSTSCDVAKGSCRFLLCLQAPADTTYRRVERPSCQRGKIRTPMCCCR